MKCAALPSVLASLVLQADLVVLVDPLIPADQAHQGDHLVPSSLLAHSSHVHQVSQLLPLDLVDQGIQQTQQDLADPTYKIFIVRAAEVDKLILDAYAQIIT